MLFPAHWLHRLIEQVMDVLRWSDWFLWTLQNSSTITPPQKEGTTKKWHKWHLKVICSLQCHLIMNRDNKQKGRKASLITWSGTKRSSVNQFNYESCTCTSWQGMETHYLGCKCQPCRWHWQHSKLLFSSSKHFKYVKIFPQQATLSCWSLISPYFKAEGFEACSWLSLGEITHVTRMQGAVAAGVYTASYLFKWIQHPLNYFAY